MNGFFLRLPCLVFVIAMVLRCESGNPVDADPGGAPPNGMPTSEARTASIHGAVMVDGSPSGGIRVSLAGAGIERTATTLLDGTFMFGNLPEGTYSLTVAASSGLACQPMTIDAAAGQTALANIPCADVRSTITGIVTAGGAPASGVRISLFPVSRSATTDENGTFNLALLPPGDYTVYAVPEGTTCEPASAALGTTETVAVTIVCRPMGALLVQVIPLEPVVCDWENGCAWPLLTARGPVSRVANEPVEFRCNEPVEFPDVEVGCEWVLFRFDDLPPGEYMLTISNSLTCQPASTTVRVAQVAYAECK